jgi:hypothetical protein
VDDVRSGRAVAPAMVWWVIGIGVFFGSALVAGTLDPSIALAVFLIGAIAAITAWLVGIVIAVRWVMALWRAG